MAPCSLVRQTCSHSLWPFDAPAFRQSRSRTCWDRSAAGKRDPHLRRATLSAVRLTPSSSEPT